MQLIFVLFSLVLLLGSPTFGHAAAANADYTLGAGDKLRITVFGEPDLSGEFEVDGTGVVALPLIGIVHAAHSTLRGFEQTLHDKLADGYLKQPRVSVEVLNYRPFFILGEVVKPGSYPYVSGMTLVNAVALAGGYTYRANTARVTLEHPNPQAAPNTLPNATSNPLATDEAPKPIDETTPILPGDIVRVPERFF